MINVNKPYRCDVCDTMIETFFTNNSNKIIFVCPICGKSHELTEKEYVHYSKSGSFS